MKRSYVHGTVRHAPKGMIHAVRVKEELLGLDEIDQLAARMRERIEARGEVTPEIVVVPGDRKETLALFGAPYAVNLVRAAMFNAAIRWTPIELD
jgi:hypothetical protein